MWTAPQHDTKATARMPEGNPIVVTPRESSTPLASLDLGDVYVNEKAVLRQLELYSRSPLHQHIYLSWEPAGVAQDIKASVHFQLQVAPTFGEGAGASAAASNFNELLNHAGLIEDFLLPPHTGTPLVVVCHPSTEGGFGGGSGRGQGAARGSGVGAAARGEGAGLPKHAGGRRDGAPVPRVRPRDDVRQGIPLVFRLVPSVWLSGESGVLDCSDYDTNAPLPMHTGRKISAYAHLRIRVAFRPRQVGERDYRIYVENVNDPGNAPTVDILTSVIPEAFREGLLIMMDSGERLGGGSVLSFGDCYTGTPVSRRLRVKNTRQTPMDIHLSSDRPAEVRFDLETDVIGSAPRHQRRRTRSQEALDSQDDDNEAADPDALQYDSGGGADTPAGTSGGGGSGGVAGTVITPRRRASDDADDDEDGDDDAEDEDAYVGAEGPGEGAGGGGSGSGHGGGGSGGGGSGGLGNGGGSGYGRAPPSALFWPFNDDNDDDDDDEDHDDELVHHKRRHHGHVCARHGHHLSAAGGGSANGGMGYSFGYGRAGDGGGGPGGGSAGSSGGAGGGGGAGGSSGGPGGVPSAANGGGVCHACLLEAGRGKRGGTLARGGSGSAGGRGDQRETKAGRARARAGQQRANNQIEELSLAPGMERTLWVRFCAAPDVALPLVGGGSAGGAESGDNGGGGGNGALGARGARQVQQQHQQFGGGSHRRVATEAAAHLQRRSFKLFFTCEEPRRQWQDDMAGLLGGGGGGDGDGGGESGGGGGGGGALAVRHCSKTIAGRAQTCTSVLSVSRPVVDFGDCNIGEYKSEYVTLENHSDLPAMAIAHVTSKVVSCKPVEMEVPPRGKLDFKVEYVARKINSNYRKTITIINCLNAYGNQEVEIRASNVDTHHVLYHSAFYRVIVNNRLRQQQVYFGHVVTNCPTLRTFTLRNISDRPLLFELSTSSPDEVQLYTVASVTSNADAAAAAAAARCAGGSTAWRSGVGGGAGGVRDEFLEDMIWGSTVDREERMALDNRTGFRHGDKEAAARAQQLHTQRLLSMDLAVASGSMRFYRQSQGWFPGMPGADGSGDSGAPKPGGAGPMTPVAGGSGAAGSGGGAGGGAPRPLSGKVLGESGAGVGAVGSSGAGGSSALAGASDAAAASVSAGGGSSRGSSGIQERGGTQATYVQSVRDRISQLCKAVADGRLRPLQPKQVFQLCVDRPVQVVVVLTLRPAGTAEELQRERTMAIAQKNINFGRLAVGEFATKTVAVANRSPVPLLYCISKSGSISSGFLKIPQGRRGVLPPHGSKKIEFAFRPALAGHFEEKLSVTNVQDETNTQVITIKARVYKPETFALVQPPPALPFGPCLVGEPSRVVPRILVHNTTNRKRQFVVEGDAASAAAAGAVKEQGAEASAAGTAEGGASERGGGGGGVGVGVELATPLAFIDDEGTATAAAIAAISSGATASDVTGRVGGGGTAAAAAVAAAAGFAASSVCAPKFMFSLDAQSSTGVSESQRRHLEEKLEQYSFKLRIAERKGRDKKALRLVSKINKVRRLLQVGRAFRDGLTNGGGGGGGGSGAGGKDGEALGNGADVEAGATCGGANHNRNAITFSLEADSVATVGVQLSFVPNAGFSGWDGPQPFAGVLRLYESRNEDVVKELPVQADLFSQAGAYHDA
ncbi:unnamed protein product, partial [Phaeothamnion confervicola]